MTRLYKVEYVLLSEGTKGLHGIDKAEYFVEGDERFVGRLIQMCEKDPTTERGTLGSTTSSSSPAIPESRIVLQNLGCSISNVSGTQNQRIRPRNMSGVKVDSHAT